MNLLDEHTTCETSIRWKLFKNKSTPTPGLFCKCHNVFLIWIPDQLAYELIDDEKVPVEPWVEIKKKSKYKKVKNLKAEDLLG